MEKVDLFENLVRFYAIKPLPFEHFDLNRARAMIKKDKSDDIIFVDDHIFYEDLVEDITNKVIEQGLNKGTVYIHLHGKNCTDRLKRNLMNLLMSVNKIFIFGTEAEWMISDEKIHFNDPEEIFTENHQRFFIYQSPAFNVALVSRRSLETSNHEGAMVYDQQAVSLLAQTVGFRVYK